MACGVGGLYGVLYRAGRRAAKCDGRGGATGESAGVWACGGNGEGDGGAKLLDNLATYLESSLVIHSASVSGAPSSSSAGSTILGTWNIDGLPDLNALPTAMAWRGGSIGNASTMSLPM